MTKTTLHLPRPTPNLLRDLSLILPDATSRANDATFEVAAMIEGKEVSLPRAISHAAELINQSTAPAIVGLADCTLETIHQSVRFAEKIRARLLPWPTAKTSINVTQQASYWATLSEAFACDFVIRPANDSASAEHPVMTAIMQHTLHSMFVGSDLSAVQRLRAAVRERGVAAIHDVIMKPVSRICVALYADTPQEVISQWHRLAQDIQFELRMSVLLLPDLSQQLNIRGATEVITWLTGVCPVAGGVDFGVDPPRRCPDAARTLEADSCDLIIELGLPDATDLPLPHNITRVRLTHTLDPAAQVSIAVPGLAPGLAARIMRFDGTIMWLCDDKTDAPPDPNITIIQELTSHCAGSIQHGETNDHFLGKTRWAAAD